MVGGVGVFPAYAGMFPTHATAHATHQRFPRIRGDVLKIDLRLGVVVQFSRIRGDVPLVPGTLANLASFSPHTRGCS